MVEYKADAKMTKKGQQYFNLTASSNMILILFSLIVAFMLGFISSPISRGSSRCSTSPPTALLLASPTLVKEVAPAATSTLGNSVDGFLSHLQTLPDDLLRFHYSCNAALPSSPAEARALVIDEVFDGRSPFTDFPPPHIARLVKEQKIKGWGSDNPVFERLIKEVRPRVVVELGTFLGASAIHMSRMIQKTLASEDVEQDFAIFCLDDFRGWPGFRKTFTDIGQEHGNVMLFNQFLQNVAYSNASEEIVPIPFATNTGLYKLCELGIKADLIEVDAGHDFHSAWTDINLAWSLMRPDGKSVMFGHDYFNGADYHGVRRAVDLFAKLKGLRVEPDGQHWIYRPLDDSARSSSGSRSRMKSKLAN